MKPLLSPLNTQKSFIIEQELTIGFLIVHTRNNFVCVCVRIFKSEKRKACEGRRILNFLSTTTRQFFSFRYILICACRSTFFFILTVWSKYTPCTRTARVGTLLDKPLSDSSFPENIDDTCYSLVIT